MFVCVCVCVCVCVRARVYHFFISFSFSWIRIVGGLCNFLGSVSSQQKFEASQPLDGPVLQLYVIAQFYFESKGKYILEERGNANPKDTKREASSPILASLFICFFLLPLGLPFVSWASQECCLFFLRSSPWSLDFPLFFFCGLFPSLTFSHCLLDSFFLF